jgi:hypothetical protein
MLNIFPGHHTKTSLLIQSQHTSSQICSSSKMSGFFDETIVYLAPHAENPEFVLDSIYFNHIKLTRSIYGLVYLLDVFQIHSFLFIFYYYCLNSELQNTSSLSFYFRCFIVIFFFLDCRHLISWSHPRPSFQDHAEWGWGIQCF